jgi:hypothetical protein
MAIITLQCSGSPNIPLVIRILVLVICLQVILPFLVLLGRIICLMPS